MSNTSIDNDDNDFVLKHRIAGAAFLLFFGALVLPWLLGAPSDAKKIEPKDVVQQEQSTEEYVPEDLENEVLTQLKDQVEADDKVYISKVTPAGFTKVSESSSANDKKEQAQKLAQQKAEQEVAAKAAAEAANKKAEEKAQQKAAELAKVQQDKNQKDKAEQEKQEQAARAKEKAEAEKVAAAEQTTKKAAQPTNSIKSGWIVQVGVFTDKSGADKMSKSLSDKGFKTSSSTVDTNKGPSTGTRVWLGPYGDRAEATKAKTDLADKTGSSGFIRAYP